MLTVSQLNSYLKNLIDGDEALNLIYLGGEISNFTNHRSGHLYFTLKDEDSTVKAVMFSRNAYKLRFVPENGMKIIALGRVSVYEAAGQYQFYVEQMQPDGLGALGVAFEQLKEKLFNEGLFDSAHKKEIPQYPEKIGIITSPTGAAIEDIKNILNRRFKYPNVFLYPALVQGDGAEIDLVNGIKYFNEQFPVDVIIIGRGGGSMEDLWAFNSELLAREVYNSKIPVISAVGHETDYTIIDFVSDLRAETPSAAAEYAVPEYSEQQMYIDFLKSSVVRSAELRIEKEKEKLESFKSEKGMKTPLNLIEMKKLKLGALYEGLISNDKALIKGKRLKKDALVSRLNSLSPLEILSRGYSLAYKDGKLIKSVSQLSHNDRLKIRLSDGEALCIVEELQ